MKILPVRGKLLDSDGQTDMMRLRVAFRNFVKVPKMDFGCNFLCYDVVTSRSNADNEDRFCTGPFRFKSLNGPAIHVRNLNGLP